MVAIGRNKNLGLVAQAAEGDAVDDPVAVALEIIARSAGDIALFIVQPAPAIGRVTLPP